MKNPLAKKLECFDSFSERDYQTVERLTGARVVNVGAKTEIIGEGVKPQFVKVLLRGWCCRQKALPNGKRQIVAILLPGDLCDYNIFILQRMDHSIVALTDVSYAQLTQEMMGELSGSSGRLAEALWWESLTRESIQREWALNLGQRTAFERVAHLMCELFVRQRALGIGNDDRVPFPMTQSDLSDATGMSNVHVNRTLQELRSRQLITLRNGELIVHNLGQLMGLAMFDPGYLHLRQVR